MRSQRWFHRLCAVGAALVLVSTAIARDADLVLKDGRRITGQLVAQTPNTVTVKVAGIESTFLRDQIRDLQIKLTLEEQAQQRRQGLKPDDFDGRFEIARWLYDHKTPEGYRLALVELDSLLQANPNHERAKLLRNIVADEVAKLNAPPLVTPAPQPPGTGPTPANAPVRPPVEGPKMLGKDEMNLIRVFEVDLATKPKLQITDKTLSEVLKKYRERPEMAGFLGTRGEAKLRTLQGWQQLDLLFKLQAREYYPSVQVREEPKTLREFKTSIHPNYVVRYCGGCHGEGKAPGFYVITAQPTRDDVIYTNLMLVRRTKTHGGGLIDKSEPAKSPLLQFGLPAKDAKTPHPNVKSWRHFFTGPADPRYAEMEAWIKSLYGTSSDDYPIDFAVPAVAPAAVPPGTTAVPPTTVPSTPPPGSPATLPAPGTTPAPVTPAPAPGPARP
jgi:hypothetical protein